MAEHHQTGKKGEALVLEHLRKEGFEIIATNWRYGPLEIDIVAREKNQLVIIEVKTRHSIKFGEPETLVNKKKQRYLAQAANEYILQNNYLGETRFDIIGVLITPHQNEVRHIRDAFFPGLF